MAPPGAGQRLDASNDSQTLTHMLLRYMLPELSMQPKTPAGALLLALFSATPLWSQFALERAAQDAVEMHCYCVVCHCCLVGPRSVLSGTSLHTCVSP